MHVFLTQVNLALAKNTLKLRARQSEAFLVPFFSWPLISGIYSLQKASQKSPQAEGTNSRTVSGATSPVMAPASNTNMADQFVRGANVSTSTPAAQKQRRRAGRCSLIGSWVERARADAPPRANKERGKRNWPLRLLPRHAGSLED